MTISLVILAFAAGMCTVRYGFPLTVWFLTKDEETGPDYAMRPIMRATDLINQYAAIPQQGNGRHVDHNRPA